MRVHEELAASGAPFSYQALTAFCRRQGIGNEPKEPVGEYHFQPGQEMQHDTSPHRAEIGGQLRSVQTASLICCYSRMLFFQLFPTFRRFECKVFLTDALQYLQGACETCLIDNTHLVVLKGTGRDMVPVPEMAAFAGRYGFRFQAHAIGDANRSARVERSFRYIETNFLAGRSFRAGPTRAKKNCFSKHCLRSLNTSRLSRSALRDTPRSSRRRLLQLVNDYPRAPLLDALRAALAYGLFDLERVERMILRQLAREYFQINPDRPDGDDDD